MCIERVILDTDIGPDCDDAAALAMLNIYMNRGKCEILGIGHCTSNPYGAGAIDAICRYYSHAEIPIGTFKGEGFLDGDECKRYNEYLTKNFPNRYRESQPVDAVKLYRRILSKEQDGSVLFIAIGPLNNLSDLLNSEADGYSPLSGKELIEKKVKRLVLMAGNFSENDALLNIIGDENEDYNGNPGAEYNVVCDGDAAKNVALNWNTPKFFLGFECGLIETCGVLQEKAAEDNPVCMAYKLYTENGSRPSWDLFTVLCALEPESDYFRLSESGKAYVTKNCRTVLVPCTDGRDYYYIQNTAPEKIQKAVHDILSEVI